MRCLVIGEWDQDHLSNATLVTITAASQLGEVDVLLPASSDVEVGQIEGVNTVHRAVHDRFKTPLAEDLAALTLSVADNYDALLAPANTFGKNFMPRVAAKLDVAQLSDITKIISNDTFERPIYAGNAIVTVQSSDAKKVITVRTTAFALAPVQGGAANIQPVQFEPTAANVRYVSSEVNQSDRPELTSARIVISGGRGLQNKENFQLIEQLADRLGAAVGASRAAVDAGFVPNDYQVGQTGKVVAPDLYFAIGISGAIQHLAGIKDSKVIVAINKDPDAPIFEVADYGLAADFFEVLPQLEAALDQLGYTKK